VIEKDKASVERDSVKKTLVVAGALLFGILNSAIGSAATIESWGGSDYVTLDTDPLKLSDPSTWRDSSAFHTPICQYAGREAAVERDFRQMRVAGQRKIGLLIWFTRTVNGEDCRGFIVNSAAGRLPDHVMANLKYLVATAGKVGFDEIQVRFGPLGTNLPADWIEWREPTYQENWGVVRNTVKALLGGVGPRLIFDLGAEGVARGQSDTYVRRLWADYTRVFPPSTSYGFSVAMAPGRVTRLLDDMKVSGPMPTQIAIDVYRNAGPALATAAREMRAFGLDLPILIQETFYDDPLTYADLLASARSNGVHIRAVMQWPVRRGMVKISEQSTPNYIYAPQ
jgi:hypothetical protein